MQETLNEVLEREMTEFLGAGKSEPDADASGLSFRLLPARSDDEGGRDRTESSAGTQRPVQHAMAFV